jgi:uncharacterized Zn finger protein
MARYGYHRFYDRPARRRARGGIKAENQRGTFGKSWWAKRWTAALDGFGLGPRLSRGRTYARSGQVLAVKVGKGKVDASVQGSRPAPYRVSIVVKVLAPADWRQVAGVLASRALFAAKLLAGEMPDDIEQVFTAARLSLFPAQGADLVTECSCPDWSNPCKHIAAVYYLLGEEFDRDPFLVFRLRGMEREELVGLIGKRDGGAASAPAKRSRKAKGGEPRPEAGEAPSGKAKPRQPITPEPGGFYGGSGVSDDFGEVSIPQTAGACLTRLGSFPFWRGNERLRDVLDPAYRRAAERGLDVFAGGGSPGDPGAPTARTSPGRSAGRPATKAPHAS